MVVESWKIKNKSYYFWNDTIYLEEVDIDLLKLIKRESTVNVDIYYIGYLVKKPEYDINSVNPLYLNIRHLSARVEKIDGSDDRYLIIDKTNKEVLNVLKKLWECIEDKMKSMKTNNVKITFGDDKVLIKN